MLIPVLNCRRCMLHLVVFRVISVTTATAKGGKIRRPNNFVPIGKFWRKFLGKLSRNDINRPNKLRTMYVPFERSRYYTASLFRVIRVNDYK